MTKKALLIISFQSIFRCWAVRHGVGLLNFLLSSTSVHLRLTKQKNSVYKKILAPQHLDMKSDDVTKIIQEIMVKVSAAKEKLLEAGIAASEATHRMYLEHKRDAFIESLIPKIKSFHGARGIYETTDGKRYRVTVVEIKKLTEQDESIYEEQRSYKVY